MAYALGFLWADGHVSLRGRVSLGIVSADANDIINTFDKTGRWHKYFYQQKHWQPQTTIAIQNKALATILINFDYRQKSFINPTKILEVIPEELKHYWYRGYWDGDGNFNLGKNIIHTDVPRLVHTNKTGHFWFNYVKN